MQFICYPKCTTCQKAKKWLDANAVAYDERHIKDEKPALDDPIRSTRPDEEIDRGRVAEMRRSRRQSIEQSAAEHLPQGMLRYECCLLTGRAKYGKL